MNGAYEKARLYYKMFKEETCSLKQREELAAILEHLKQTIAHDGYDRSEILSFILCETVVSSDELIDRIIADVRYQGTEVTVPDPEPLKWRPALVGNIVDEHEFGENHEIRQGTKSFRPGAKVYLAPGQWGDGYENVCVIGYPRHQRHLIEIVMERSKITNFRAQKVYSPSVLRKMQQSKHCWWDSSEEEFDCIKEWALVLNHPDIKFDTAERQKKVNDVCKILAKKYDVIDLKISKTGQLYPVVNISANHFCIEAEFYGYVREDASPYIEHYYQISAEEIAEKIEKQIEAYEAYRRS